MMVAPTFSDNPGEFLICKITNKNTIITNLWIITLLHVSTQSCHPQGDHIHYLGNEGNEYELSDDDTIVSKHTGAW